MADAKIVLSAVDQTSAVFASVQKNMLGLGQQAARLSAVLSGIGATGMVLGLATMVRESANAIDAFNDLKDATGASIENISALDRVARLTGAEFGTVADILVKFNKVLTDAGDSESEAAGVLKALGLNAMELKRLDPAEALQLTARALAQFADDGEKARAIQILFSKSTKEFASFLKDLADQGALVATVTTQQSVEAEKFNKEIFKLKTNIGDLSRSMSVDLITSINATIEKFRQGAKEGRSFFSVASGVYWGNIRKFYGMEEPTPQNTGADGSWGEPQSPQAPPSLNLPGNDDKRLRAEQMKRAKELAEEAKRLREQDLAGWVKYADAVIEEGERIDEIERRQTEQRNEYEEMMRQKDLDGWVAYAQARVDEDFDMARQIADQQIQALQDTNDIGRELGLTFSSAAEDAMVNWRDLGEVVKGVGKDIARVIYRKTITEPLAGAVSDFTKSINWKDVFSSYDGGGFTGYGARSGGLDGRGGFMAMLHPNETVIDHTKPSSGGGAVVINQTINVDSRSDQASIMAAIRAGGEAVKADILRSRSRGGAFA